MIKKNNKKNDKKGISFDKLIPFLSYDFKVYLSKDEYNIRKCFSLHSDGAYKAFMSYLKEDIYKTKSKSTNRWDSTLKMESRIRDSNPSITPIREKRNIFSKFFK